MRSFELDCLEYLEEKDDNYFLNKNFIELNKNDIIRIFSNNNLQTIFKILENE